jgi:folate-dependent phosphoribosylglycinamide formyltransferase PurN
MNDKKIVMLAGQGISTNILYQALKDEFAISTIILEKPVNKKEFLKKRIKKLGIWQVFGQTLFHLIIVKFLNLTSFKRKKEILKSYRLKNYLLPADKIININSVNDNDCLKHLQNINPDLVIVNGTRIISKKILSSVGATFINMHTGITPMYRGVHGGYWALVNNDTGNCGVTIHIVDPGIDTGTILYQKNIIIANRDNFVTYPLLQLGEGISCMKMAIRDIFKGSATPKNPKTGSRLWYHPTIWEYIYNRISKGIK